MATELWRWQWLAAAFFALLFFWLKAWRGGREAGWWLKAWLGWMGLSLFAALIGLFIVRSFPRASPWLARWNSFQLQARLWMLISAPWLLGLSRDLWLGGGWERSRLGFWLGLALGPWLAGAYAWSQFTALAPILAFLGLLSALLGAPEPGFKLLKVLAAFHLLGFAHAVHVPGRLGSALLVAVMAAGFNPFSRASALGGTALGCLALLLRGRLGLDEGGWASALFVCASIALGWTLSKILRKA